MIDKCVDSVAEAVADIHDGAVIMISGFAAAGSPLELTHALIDQGARHLTVINNNTGSGYVGMAALIAAGQIDKVITSFPRTANSKVFPEVYRAGKIELELVPQGTLAERIRAGGAGIPAFYTQTAVNTVLAEGKEVRSFDNKEYVLEHGLVADYALIKCETADCYGNLVYNKTGRNFGPIMAMAAKITCVQATQIVKIGDIDPEAVVTPSIFTHRIVAVANPDHESKLIAAGKVYP